MDVVGKVMGSFNAEALKEPRGFIKILQWILSIFAFATTTSVNTQLSFYAKCPDFMEMVRQTTSVSYPFRIEDQTYQMPLCKNGTSPDVSSASYVGGSASAAEFYVFVGVIVFLYCMAALILYIFFDEQYRKNNLFSIGDFVVSCVLTALWLISSAAWAQGLVNLKYDTDLKESDLYRRIPDCVAYTCHQDVMPNFASLNVSIIFGFLNMVVWGGNLWFLYKETPWFKVRSKPPTTPTQSQETDPQRI
ncbi:synaptophysin-like [Pecten maximus]|uniref:synaptophysin-like n=1 Tax=Pecten maximus TaxID=6579 RepID=UPI0014582D21|nr:synaptophysin-like [Pecten maximus]